MESRREDERIKIQCQSGKKSVWVIQRFETRNRLSFQMDHAPKHLSVVHL